jgi:hypothetical protein
MLISAQDLVPFYRNNAEKIVQGYAECRDQLVLCAVWESTYSAQIRMLKEISFPSETRQDNTTMDTWHILRIQRCLRGIGKGIEGTYLAGALLAVVSILHEPFHLLRSPGRIVHPLCLPVLHYLLIISKHLSPSQNISLSCLANSLSSL